MTDQNTILPQNQNAKWPDPPWSIPPYVVQTYKPLVNPQSLQGNSFFQNTPSWVFKDSNNNPATIDIDFVNNLAYLDNGAGVGLVTLPANLLSTTRASAENYTDTSCNVTYVNSNIAALGNNGLQVFEARTNVVLWNNDLTNAAWTASNVTAAKDQTGPDGVANSASSVIATAGNGTILQAITLGSAAAFQSAYVKRLIGSGTVNMTMDNGATWTAVTVTGSWTQVSIPTQ